MTITQKIKDFFRRGKYVMTTQNLSSIIDHPKIAISEREYKRILNNLKYYESSFGDVSYLNTDGDTMKRPMNHLAMGRIASRKIASLVFNEKAEISLDDEVANKFVNKVLKNDKFNKNFERYLESCLALGGLAMRPYVDGNDINVSFIQAPVFFPLQANTQDISSAAIVTKSVKSFGNKNKYYTLFEIHEWNKSEYKITNELYRSDNKTSVGQRVPLNELYDDLEEVAFLSNLSRPIFTYLKPAGMNNKDINSPLGLSIFDNAKTVIDFINTTYDEFMWEVKMGQRRVAVPEHLTTMHIRTQDGNVVQKTQFEATQNVYKRISGKDMDSDKIVDLTTEIRSQGYIDSINHSLRLFELGIGVSSGSFSFDGQSVKTATEIVSENSDTYQLRNSIVTLVEQSLKELIVSILELAKSYDLYAGNIPDLDSISINLDDGVFTDRNAELDYWIKVVNAGFAPTSKGIEKVLNVTEEEAKRIEAELNGSVVDNANSTRSVEDVQVYGE